MLRLSGARARITAYLERYAKSEEERNLSILGQRGTGRLDEINNGGTMKRERERKGERKR
jgi:hypothetical protein